jgi:Xaa-Pro aminopeptidase
MDNTRQQLFTAEQTAKELFKTVSERGLIVPGKSERVLNDEVVKLASEQFGITDFWHKKIIRAGANTMEPYSSNPPDVIMQTDDIVILDFGPIVNGWEADLGRTYVIGDSPLKCKLIADIDTAWHEANTWYGKQSNCTGAELFNYACTLARQFGYEYAGEIAGHIVGQFPHEQLNSGNLGLDIHPDNHQDMRLTDPQGAPRHWIFEIHFVDRKNQIGGFFEQLMT